jgi:hypothetical protein
MPCSIPAGQLRLDTLPHDAYRAAVQHCHVNHRRARPHPMATSVTRRAEAEAALFRGGTLLLSGFDKHTATEIVTSSVEAATEDDLIAALASFAERAWMLYRRTRSQR